MRTDRHTRREVPAAHRTLGHAIANDGNDPREARSVRAGGSGVLVKTTGRRTPRQGVFDCLAEPAAARRLSPRASPTAWIRRCIASRYRTSATFPACARRYVVRGRRPMNILAASRRSRPVRASEDARPGRRPSRPAASCSVVKSSAPFERGECASTLSEPGHERRCRARSESIGVIALRRTSQSARRSRRDGHHDSNHHYRRLELQPA